MDSVAAYKKESGSLLDHKLPTSKTQVQNINEKIIYAIVNHLLGYSHGKYVWIIGLKAQGNYSDQFWSNKVLV